MSCSCSRRLADEINRQLQAARLAIADGESKQALAEQKLNEQQQLLSLSFQSVRTLATTNAAIEAKLRELSENERKLAVAEAKAAQLREALHLQADVQKERLRQVLAAQEDENKQQRQANNNNISRLCEEVKGLGVDFGQMIGASNEKMLDQFGRMLLFHAQSSFPRRCALIPQPTGGTFSECLTRY